jgi:predicted DNA-binding transcriptional regulator YafY
LKPSLFDAGLLAPPQFLNFTDGVNVAGIRRAIREQRKVALRYADESGAITERKIWPIAISYFDAQRLIVGWCEMRQDFRHFRTDRMIAAEILVEKYQERRKVLFDKWHKQHGRGDIANVDAIA